MSDKNFVPSSRVLSEEPIDEYLLAADGTELIPHDDEPRKRKKVVTSDAASSESEGSVDGRSTKSRKKAVKRARKVSF